MAGQDGSSLSPFLPALYRAARTCVVHVTIILLRGFRKYLFLIVDSILLVAFRVPLDEPRIPVHSPS